MNPIAVEEGTPASFLSTDTMPISLGPVSSVKIQELEPPKPKYPRRRGLVHNATPVSAVAHVGNVHTPLEWGMPSSQKKLAWFTGLLAVNVVMFYAWAVLYLETL